MAQPQGPQRRSAGRGRQRVGRGTVTLDALPPAKIDRFAREVVAAIADKVESYRALCPDPTARDADAQAASAVYEDLVVTNKENLRVYFSAITTERMPGPDEVAELVDAARRRVHQGVPIEDVVRAYRVGAGAMLACLLESSPDVDARVVARLTVEYVDCVTTAAERAYVIERRELVEPSDEASHAFLARLVAGEFADTAEVDREAASLGMDLTRPHLAVIVAPRFTSPARPGIADRSVVAIVDGITRDVREAHWALLPSGLCIVVRDASNAGVESLVRATLATGPVADASLTAGVGGSHTGADGLLESIREAERARAVGGIVEPNAVTYRYEAFRYCDVFRSGDVVDEFVSTVLGPLVAHDRLKNSDLVPTLYEFFASGMNRKEAARRLRIHPNTLDYRLRRAEEVLGETALRPGLSFRYQLACRLLPIASSVARREEG